MIKHTRENCQDLYSTVLHTPNNFFLFLHDIFRIELISSSPFSVMFHATHIPKGTTCTTCKSPSYILVVEWGHVLIKPSNHGGDLPEKSHRAPRWQQTHATWHNSSLLRRCRRKGLALSSKLTEFTSRLKLQNWMCHHLNFQTLYISQY